jgi:hypothetical protein
MSPFLLHPTYWLMVEYSKISSAFSLSNHVLLLDLGIQYQLKMCSILEKKNIQTEPKANDFTLPKSTVNIEKWVANLSPIQQKFLLSTLLKQTQSKIICFSCTS